MAEQKKRQAPKEDICDLAFNHIHHSLILQKRHEEADQYYLNKKDYESRPLEDRIKLLKNDCNKYNIEIPPPFDDLLFKRPRKAKRQFAPTLPVLIPKEAVGFEEIIHSGGPFSKLLREKEFDFEMKKDIAVFKKETGDIIEEYRFDKEAIYNEHGKEYIPNPKGLTDAGRALFKLLQEKGSNPFSYFPKENLLAYGYTEDEIKQLPGITWQRTKQATIQIAEMRYKKFKITKDGKKKLLTIINSPVAYVDFPDERGKPVTAMINPEHLKHWNEKTAEFLPGTYKMLPPPINPYSNKPVEKKAYDWLIKNVRGRNLTIKAETILKEKLGTPESDYKRKKLCLDRMARWLKTATQEGYHYIVNPRGSGSLHFIKLLERYDLKQIESVLKSELSTKRLTAPSLLGDCRRWTIEFFSPVTLKVDYEPTEADGALIENMLAFLYDENEFGIRNPREKTEKYLILYLAKIGLDDVKGIYEDIKASPDLFSQVGDKRVNKGAQLINELELCLQKKSKLPKGLDRT